MCSSLLVAQLYSVLNSDSSINYRFNARYQGYSRMVDCERNCGKYLCIVKVLNLNLLLLFLKFPN